MLRPRAAAVVTKTPAGTAMAGKQTTINNQLKAAAATATETATVTLLSVPWYLYVLTYLPPIYHKEQNKEAGTSYRQI